MRIVLTILVTISTSSTFAKSSSDFLFSDGSIVKKESLSIQRFDSTIPKNKINSFSPPEEKTTKKNNDITPAPTKLFNEEPVKEKNIAPVAKPTPRPQLEITKEHTHEVIKPVVTTTNSTTFQFEHGSCSIFNSVDLDFDDQHKARVNLSLGMKNDLPFIEIKFENIKPVKASLLWDSSQVVRKPYFKQSIVSSILEEANRPFELIKGDNLSFVSMPWSFLRLQHFMTLFLSKNFVYIDIVDEQGNLYRAPFTLQGSTNAFVQLAGSCYLSSSTELSEQVSNYITKSNLDDGEIVYTRSSSLADAYSDGFGLTNFAHLESVMPVLSNNDAKILKPSSVAELYESYEKMSSLKKLLEEKYSVQQLIAKATASKDFQQNSERWMGEYSRIESILPRAIELGGDSKEDKPGLIAETEALLINTKEKLADMEAKIAQLKIEVIAASENSLISYKQQLEPYSEHLSSYQTLMSGYIQEIANINKKISSMQEIFTVFSTWLQSYQGELLQQDDAMNYVQIVEAQAKQQDSQTRIEALEALIVEIGHTVENMSEISQLADQIAPAYEEYIAARTEASYAINSIKNADENLFVLNQSYPKFVRDQFHQNIKLAEEIFVDKVGTDRNLDTEVSFHRELIALWYQKLDELVASTKQPLFIVTMCASKNYKSSDSYCLEEQNLSDNFDKAASEFFEQLSGKDLDKMLASYITSIPVPWPADSQSKPATLFSRLSEEKAKISSSLLTEIESTWTFIQFLRWRINTAKRHGVSEAVYKFQFYQQAHEQFVAQMELEERRRVELTSSLEPLRNRTEEAQGNVARYENQYLEFSKKFVDESVSKLNNVVNRAKQAMSDQNLFNYSFTNCTFPMADFESCKTDILGAQESVPKEKNQEIISYASLAKSMVVSIEARNIDFQNTIKEIENKISSLDSEKESYIKENNLQQLIEEKAKLENQLAEAKANLKALMESQSDYREKTKSYSDVSVKYTEELAGLQQIILQVEAKLEPYEKNLKETCLNVLAEINKLEAANQKIKELLDIQSETHFAMDDPVCKLVLSSRWNNL